MTTTIILFIVALVFSLGFLLLVLTLIPAINQLRLLLADMERTSGEIRDLARQLNKVGTLAEERLEHLDGVLASSKRTVDHVGDTLKFVNQNILKRSAGFFALLPAIRLGWKLVKKIKGGK